MTKQFITWVSRYGLFDTYFDTYYTVFSTTFKQLILNSSKKFQSFKSVYFVITNKLYDAEKHFVFDVPKWLELPLKEFSVLFKTVSS